MLQASFQSWAQRISSLGEICIHMHAQLTEKKLAAASTEPLALTTPPRAEVGGGPRAMPASASDPKVQCWRMMPASSGHALSPVEYALHCLSIRSPVVQNQSARLRALRLRCGTAASRSASHSHRGCGDPSSRPQHAQHAQQHIRISTGSKRSRSDTAASAVDDRRPGSSCGALDVEALLSPASILAGGLDHSSQSAMGLLQRGMSLRGLEPGGGGKGRVQWR